MKEIAGWRRSIGCPTPIRTCPADQRSPRRNGSTRVGDNSYPQRSGAGLSGIRPERRPDVSRARWPARYEIRVDAVLDGRWAEWFEGLQIDTEGDETILAGLLRDQPALHGVLDKLRDLGLSIVTVHRLPSDGVLEIGLSSRVRRAHVAAL
jgi:hypothetical protein